MFPGRANCSPVSLVIIGLLLIVQRHFTLIWKISEIEINFKKGVCNYYGKFGRHCRIKNVLFVRQLIVAIGECSHRASIYK